MTQYTVLGKARWCNRKHGAFVKRVCKLENLGDANFPKEEQEFVVVVFFKFTKPIA